MHVLGAAAVLLASVGAGLVTVRQKRRRLRCLRELRDSLAFLAGELAGKRSPLPELFQDGSIQASGETGDFFRLMRDSLSLLGEKSFFELWENAVKQLLPLSEAERWELIGLGRQLGRTELSRQLSALDGCCRFLAARLDREERLFRSDRRLLLGVPAAMGALLLILLL